MVREVLDLAGAPLPPIDDVNGELADTIAARSPLSKALVGGPESLRAGLARFVADHQPDGIIITAQIFHQAKRIRSLDIAAAARDALAIAA